MRLKEKKYRYFLTKQQNIQSNYPEKILHEYSENLDHQILSKSFAYTHMNPLNGKGSSLSTWGGNRLTIDASPIIAKASIKVQLPQQNHKQFDLRKQYDEQRKVSKLVPKQRMYRSFSQQKSMKANTTRTSCFASVVSPKFDDKNIQPRIQQSISHNYHTNTRFVCNQMRETMRQRKGLMIKRVKKDLNSQFLSKSYDKSHSIEQQVCCLTNESIQRSTQRNQKICKEIEIKFTQRSVESGGQCKKIVKQSNSSRISKLLTYKHSHSNREKNLSIKARIHEKNPDIKGVFKSFKEVNILRSLLNRQNFSKILIS